MEEYIERGEFSVKRWYGENIYKSKEKLLTFVTEKT